jgi:hypothetical protein
VIAPKPTSKQFGLFESKDRIDKNYREAEKKQFDRAVCEALLKPPESMPLAITRRGIVNSFVFMYVEKRGIKTEVFLIRKLAVFGGKSLLEMLEMEHEWKLVQDWMKALREAKDEFGDLLEEFKK